MVQKPKKAVTVSASTFGDEFQVSMCGPVHKIGSLTLDEDCFAGGDYASRF